MEKSVRKLGDYIPLTASHVANLKLLLVESIQPAMFATECSRQSCIGKFGGAYQTKGGLP